jgi:hypothetical protein
MASMAVKLMLLLSVGKGLLPQAKAWIAQLHLQLTQLALVMLP